MRIKTNRKNLDEYLKQFDMLTVLSQMGIDAVNEFLGSPKKDFACIKCMFHEEITGSFVIDLKHNTFKCFGCGITGDLIDLIMLYTDYDPTPLGDNSFDFFEAIRWLEHAKEAE